MRIAAFLFVLMWQGVVMAGNLDLIQLRELYYKAKSDKQSAEAFCEAAVSAKGIDKHLITGYAGISWMMKAEHAFNPYNKLSYFFKGRDLLEAAIAGDKNNAELRFLRYCVQTNAPGFLGYNGNKTADKALIAACYPLMKDNDLKKRIRDYMLSGNHCTPEERKLFQ
jgi:hypothetical protein